MERGAGIEKELERKSKAEFLSSEYRDKNVSIYDDHHRSRPGNGNDDLTVL